MAEKKTAKLEKEALKDVSGGNHEFNYGNAQGHKEVIIKHTKSELNKDELNRVSGGCAKENPKAVGKRMDMSDLGEALSTATGSATAGNPWEKLLELFHFKKK